MKLRGKHSKKITKVRRLWDRYETLLIMIVTVVLAMLAVYLTGKMGGFW